MLFISGVIVLKRLQALNLFSNSELCQKQYLTGVKGEGEERTREYCRMRFKALEGRRSRMGIGGIPLALSSFA